MDDGNGFLVAILLCVIVYIFGPTIRGVDAEMLRRAEVACAPVGGIKYVEPGTFYNRYEVGCKNGMIIRLKWNN